MLAVILSAYAINREASGLLWPEASPKHPSGSSLKLLHLIERKGLEAVL
jgi:DNA-binding transcriptional regulator YiaG